jgi:hypothetical protein
MIRYARQVLVFLEPSKGATNGIRNFLVYENPNENIPRVRDPFVAATGRVISRMTVNRNLLAMRVHAYRPFRMLSLTARHKSRRLE